MRSKILATLLVLTIIVSAVGVVTAQENDTEITIDNDGEVVTVEKAANQTISGETSLDPGTELTVVADSSGTFYKTKQVEVAEDGTFNATFDFEQFDNGTEFDVVVRYDGDSLAEVDGVIGGQMTTMTTLSTSTVETTDAPTETTETTTVAETTLNEDGQPGFGLGVVLAAFAGVALLARRA